MQWGKKTEDQIPKVVDFQWHDDVDDEEAMTMTQWFDGDKAVVEKAFAVVVEVAAIVGFIFEVSR